MNEKKHPTDHSRLFTEMADVEFAEELDLSNDDPKAEADYLPQDDEQFDSDEESTLGKR